VLITSLLSCAVTNIRLWWRRTWGFLDHLNTYDRNLEFTLEIENVNKILFLDVLIIHSSDKFRFYYLQKVHKRHRYLHFKFNYPWHVKRSIVISYEFFFIKTKNQIIIKKFLIKKIKFYERYCFSKWLSYHFY